MAIKARKWCSNLCQFLDEYTRELVTGYVSISIRSKHDVHPPAVPRFDKQFLVALPKFANFAEDSPSNGT